MPWKDVVPVLLDCPPGQLCQRRYPGHPHGCPNYGQRATCPPSAPRWKPSDLDTARYVAIWNVFDFGAHVARMAVLHPQWTQRQRECCLYWQAGARAKLKEEVLRFYAECRIIPQPYVCYTPEARGVDVTATMVQLGVMLEWPPTAVTHQVALARIAVSS